MPDPDDALAFAVELITDEVRGAIENHAVAAQHLGPETLKAWIDAQGAESFTDAKVTVTADSVKSLLDRGEAGFKEPIWRKNSDLTQQSSKIKEMAFSRVFYPDEASALSANKRLARLSLFRNEALGRRRTAPEGWRPYLSLGTVLRPVVQVDGGPDFLVCLQPGCDSVRLGEATNFPFQIARVADQQFNVILKHADDDGSPVRVDWRPRDGVMIRFAPEQPAGRVLAVKADEGTDFVFSSENAVQYRWIGDLKPLKAQSIVAQIGSRMQGVALDDLEWLRRQSEAKN